MFWTAEPTRTIIMLQPPKFQSNLEIPRKRLHLNDETTAADIIGFIEVSTAAYRSSWKSYREGLWETEGKGVHSIEW